MIAGIVILTGVLTSIVITDLRPKEITWENYGISSHFIAQMIAVLDDITKENKE